SGRAVWGSSKNGALTVKFSRAAGSAARNPVTLFDHLEKVEPNPESSGEEPQAPEAKRPPRWSLSNWSVRWKVLAIALVPMLLAMVFGGLRISNALSDAARLRLAADRAEMVPAIADYMSALGN